MEEQRIEELKEKLRGLLQRQHELTTEIKELQLAVEALSKGGTQAPAQVEPLPEKVNTPTPPKAAPSRKVRTDWERFIGENLISKLGILITIVGVGIGTKYAIDKELINPATRIILGYLFSLGLLGVALYLKKKYVAFSAVLLSGAMSILYFLTFFAYTYYGFLGKFPAFGLMGLLTIATVYAALQYGKPVIAHLGLVGSYAIPFLLSDGTGQVVYLLLYMALINAGILVVSVRKYWISLHYAAFACTWIIFTFWYFDQYRREDFLIGVVFAALFYVLFYASFLANKLLLSKKFVRSDIWLLLTNSFIFFTLGFVLISDYSSSDYPLALFTFGNALVHLGVAWVVRRVDQANGSLFRFLAGLAIAYITLTIPILLDRAWITILWLGEACALTWAGRDQAGLAYRRMSYALILLAFGGLLSVWLVRNGASVLPFANGYFVVSLLFAGGMAVINWLYVQFPVEKQGRWLPSLMSYLSPGILLFATYFSIAQEIHSIWMRSDSSVSMSMAYLSLVIYSICFLAGMSAVNSWFFNKRALTYTILVLLLITLSSVVQTTAVLNELRAYYLEGGLSAAIFLFRYVLFLAIAGLAYVLRRSFLQNPMDTSLKLALEILLLLTILWASSTELIHWLELFGVRSTDKLALTILWGVSALIWISVGIVRARKPYRIAAMSLFGITLIKLFFYDISHLNNLSKTIVMVILGVLMLVASFLYNKLVQKEHDPGDGQ